MSESIVDASHVEEIVTQVLTQIVQDGDDEDQMSVELVQEQVELHLEYWLIGVFIGTQTFSVPTNSYKPLSTGRARSAY